MRCTGLTSGRGASGAGKSLNVCYECAMTRSNFGPLQWVQRFFEVFVCFWLFLVGLFLVGWFLVGFWLVFGWFLVGCCCVWLFLVVCF